MVIDFLFYCQCNKLIHPCCILEYKCTTELTNLSNHFMLYLNKVFLFDLQFIRISLEGYKTNKLHLIGPKMLATHGIAIQSHWSGQSIETHDIACGVTAQPCQPGPAIKSESVMVLLPSSIDWAKDNKDSWCSHPVILMGSLWGCKWCCPTLSVRTNIHIIWLDFIDHNRRLRPWS